MASLYIYAVDVMVPTANDKDGRAAMSQVVSPSTEAQADAQESCLQASLTGASAHYGSLGCPMTQVMVDRLIDIATRVTSIKYYVRLRSDNKLKYTHGSATIDSAWSIASSLSDAGTLTLSTSAANSLAALTAAERLTKRATAFGPNQKIVISTGSPDTPGVVTSLPTGSEVIVAGISRNANNSCLLKIGDHTNANDGFDNVHLAATLGSSIAVTAGATEGSTSLTAAGLTSGKYYYLTSDKKFTSSGGDDRYVEGEIILCSTAGTPNTVSAIKRTYVGANIRLYDLTNFLTRNLTVTWLSGGQLMHTGAALDQGVLSLKYIKGLTIQGAGAAYEACDGYTGIGIRMQCCDDVTLDDLTGDPGAALDGSCRFLSIQRCNNVTMDTIQDLESHILYNDEAGGVGLTGSNLYGKVVESSHGQYRKTINLSGLRVVDSFKIGNPSTTDGHAGGGYTVNVTNSPLLSDKTGTISGDETDVYFDAPFKRITIQTFANVAASPTSAYPRDIEFGPNCIGRNTDDTTAFHVLALGGADPRLTSIRCKTGCQLRNDGTGDNALMYLQGKASSPSLSCTVVLEAGCTFTWAGTQKPFVFANGAFDITINDGSTWSGPGTYRVHLNVNATGTIHVPSSWNGAGYILNDAGASVTIAYDAS